MTTYERPVKAALHVHLDNGDSWPATDDDLTRFGLVRRSDAYHAFDQALLQALRAHGVLAGGLTDAHLNPVRYLVEVALCYPDLLDHPDHEGWASVADLERALEGACR